MKSRFQYVTLIVLIAAMIFSFIPLSPAHAEPNLDPPDPTGKQMKMLAATLDNPGFDNGNWYWDGYVPGADASFVPSHWTIWYKDGTIPLYTRVTTKKVDGKEAVRGHAYWNGAEGLQAGLYQVIDGVTPCLNYRFRMYGQAMPVEDHDVLYGMRVGVHPTGYAPSNKAIDNADFNQIVWGDALTNACLNTWCLNSVTAEAQASKITVFMYAHMNARTGHDMIWDAGSFEQVDRTENLIDASQPLPDESSVIQGHDRQVDEETNTAAISWNTGSTNTYGQLLYREEGGGAWQYSGIQPWGTSHQVNLTGLQVGITYEYVLVSYGHIGGTCKAVVSREYDFSIATPLTGVSITGDEDPQHTGYIGQDYTFTAQATPSDATTPIDFEWTATGQTKQTNQRETLEDSITFSWDTPGHKTIQVNASNVANTVQATYAIEIIGDEYEPDDECSQANEIVIDAPPQAHTFHNANDVDWVSFDASADTAYLIEALTPPGSDADVSLYVYDSCASGNPLASRTYTYTPDARLPFTATRDGNFYLFLHQDPSTSGDDMAYDLSVRTLPQQAAPGAVVLVAGKLEDDDPLQSNIYHAADAAYQTFKNHGYDDEQIFYLSTDASNPDVNDPNPTYIGLQNAITWWAKSKLTAPNTPFTLYMVGHGGDGVFYLNGSEDQVSPSDLNSWLTQLENETFGIQVNVVIDAPKSGSFVDPISAEGRVVVASTGAQRLAWISEEGVLFSDYFAAALNRGLSLYAGFQEAAWAVDAVQPAQTPRLDADGETAAGRSFMSVETLDHLKYPPYIASAGVGEIVDGQGVITAAVRDDGSVARVWAMIYPPMYEAPDPEGVETLTATAFPTVALPYEGDDIYRADYEDFSTLYLGADRVVIYAMDDDGLMARPLSAGGKHYVYLPLVLRH